ncbi:MAG: hypothetical protein NT069_22990, partial [Planctomycetota bacterium]|nr:hypothetical protein [Planctomycetota bacterium]
SVRVMGSTAGATASGAAELIAETTVAALTPLGVPVDLNLDFIDATTFSGLGDRTGRNSAATICELSAHCLTKGGLPLDRVTRRMDLLALPPFRHEKGTRDEFIALDEQAITCSEMSAFLNVVRPNHALDGALGTILYRQVDYFRQLARESEVANEVAHIYAPMLANAIGSAVVARELVTGLFTDARSAPLIRETVDNIVEDVQSTTDEDLLRAIERPGEHIECSASVETASGEKLALETVDEYFLQPAVTLTDAVRRLSLLRTLHALAVQELANVVAILGENAETLANQRKSVVKLATRIHSGLWFWNNDKKLRGLILQAAQLLRSTADNTLHLEAVKLSLERAVAAIASTLQLNESHLLGIQSALESFRPRGKPLPGVGSLVVADLDRAFRELSPIVSKPRDRQIDILCAQVVRVTVAGLARIVEVPEPRLELIVDRIVNGPVRHHGPYIGSTCHPEGSQLVIVLPPLMPAVAEEIKGMLNSVEPKAVVVFTDFAAAGVNVMRYRFFRPKTVAQLFPGVLARDLEAARNDENKHLFFPHGDQRLNDLGISAAS